MAAVASGSIKGMFRGSGPSKWIAQTGGPPPGHRTLPQGTPQGDKNSTVALLEPELLDPDDFTIISELPSKDRGAYASIYRRGHEAQKKQAKAWKRLTESFGEEIDGNELNNRHTRYWDEVNVEIKQLLDLNEEIRQKNKELSQAEQCGLLLVMYLHGPPLQRMVRNKKKKDKGKETWSESASEDHWESVIAALNADQKLLIAPHWSLATALTLHRNKLANNPTYFGTDIDNGIQQILREKDDSVQQLFRTNPKFLRGTTEKDFKSYVNFAKMQLPDHDTVAQPTYRDPTEEEKTEPEPEEDAEESEDGPEPVPTQAEDAPAAVQRLLEKAGGWNGPLTMYMKGIVDANPPKDRYEELLRKIDQDISDLDPNGMRIDSNGKEFVQTEYYHKFALKPRLKFMVSSARGFWRLAAKVLDNDPSLTEKERNQYQKAEDIVREYVKTAKWPSNFVDSIIPPKNMLIQGFLKNNTPPPAPTGSLDNSGTYPQVLKQFVDAVKGPLENFLDHETDLDHAWEIIAESVEAYRGEFLNIGFNIDDIGVTKQAIEALDMKSQQLGELRVQLKEDSGDIALANELKKQEDEVRETLNEIPAIAQLVLGDDKIFWEELAKEKTELGYQAEPGSRFIVPEGWKSPPGTIIHDGIHKQIIQIKSDKRSSYMLLQWTNEGASLPSFELVASGVCKGKMKECTGGEMKMGVKKDLAEYFLYNCTLGGVAQVRRRDPTRIITRAPNTYICISNKGEEKWFTRSDLISVFGDQIIHAEEAYLQGARAKRVTATPGWKNMLLRNEPYSEVRSRTRGSR
jgi:cell division septum initiation protein DivIVA